MDEIKHPVAKVVSGLGFSTIAQMSWGELAQFLACVYSALIIIEFIWKRWAKPVAKYFGWIKPTTFPDTTINGDLK